MSGFHHTFHQNVILVYYSEMRFLLIANEIIENLPGEIRAKPQDSKFSGIRKFTAYIFPVQFSVLTVALVKSSYPVFI